MWNDRLEGCPDAPLLRYNRSQKQADGKCDHFFTIVSGNLEPRQDDRSYYDWMLVPENGETTKNDEDVTPEIFFDDLLRTSPSPSILVQILTPQAQCARLPFH